MANGVRVVSARVHCALDVAAVVVISVDEPRALGGHVAARLARGGVLIVRGYSTAQVRTGGAVAGGNVVATVILRKEEFKDCG